MDILHLVDRLEAALRDSRTIPFSNSIMVDEDRIYNVVDQMRAAIPEEVRRANRIEAEKERILAQAHEEADRLRALAREEAGELVKRDSIVAAAHQRAEAIMARGSQESAGVREEADRYVLNVLGKLEEDLLRSLSVVRNGMHKLEVEAQDLRKQQAVSKPAEKVDEDQHGSDR